MTIICCQQSNYRIIHHLQWLLLTLPQMGHWTRYLQWLIMIGIRLPSSFSSHVISSIALSKVGRTTEINWLGSLCFVKHPNSCLWCLTTLRLWWSPPILPQSGHHMCMTPKSFIQFVLIARQYKAFLKNKKMSRISLLASFFTWFLKKGIYLVIFYYLTKFHCLIALTSWDIVQYVFYNYLLTMLWPHKFWN